MFVPGPRRTETCSFLHSSPSASPILRISSVSHEQAVAEAVGKQIAGTPKSISLFSDASPFLRTDIAYNQPKSLPYATENPWA